LTLRIINWRNLKMYNLSGFNYRLASVPNQYDNIKVITGSEEKIYDKVYVHAVVQNHRLIKLLKDSVKFQ